MGKSKRVKVGTYYSERDKKGRTTGKINKMRHCQQRREKEREKEQQNNQEISKKLGTNKFNGKQGSAVESARVNKIYPPNQKR